MGDRYTVISADCHAGGQLHDYRTYLEPRYRDEFDTWAATYEIPYDDLKGPNGSRNWDSARRRRELEDDGIVAEVIYPNLAFFCCFHIRDPELQIATARLYNEWAADRFVTASERFAPIAVLPVADIAAGYGGEVATR